MVLLFVLGVALQVHVTKLQPVKRLRAKHLVELIPQQSCYYQQHNRRLTCNCDTPDTAAFINLRMKYYVSNSRNEIRSVLLKQCRELHVSLELQGVDPTRLPFSFYAIGEVHLIGIDFEPAFSDTQELRLDFRNVEKLFMQNLIVEDTLEVEANNVKQMHLVNSTFAHIPRRGLTVSKANLLNIQSSQFDRVFPRSIVVEQTREVKVSFNEMRINALEVVYAKDGSHLEISCNKVFGEPLASECLTTTAAPTTPRPRVTVITHDDERNEDLSALVLSLEVLGGIIIGVVIICTTIIVCCICMVAKKRRPKSEGPPPPPPPAPVPAIENNNEAKTEVDAAVETDDLLEHDGENEGDEEKHKFVSPAWLEEIQQNRMFNRQKSLLSEDDLTELTDSKKPHGRKKAPAPKPPAQPQQQSELPLEETPKESSKTESEEEYKEDNGAKAEVEDAAPAT